MAWRPSAQRASVWLPTPLERAGAGRSRTCSSMHLRSLMGWLSGMVAPGLGSLCRQVGAHKSAAVASLSTAPFSGLRRIACEAPHHCDWKTSGASNSIHFVSVQFTSNSAAWLDGPSAEECNSIIAVSSKRP